MPNLSEKEKEAKLVRHKLLKITEAYCATVRKLQEGIEDPQNKLSCIVALELEGGKALLRAATTGKFRHVIALKLVLPPNGEEIIG